MWLLSVKTVERGERKWIQAATEMSKLVSGVYL
jgi:hypothetical protein